MAGLLTFGSIYSPRLPIRHLKKLTDLGGDQWLLRLSYPNTAAGPYRISTGFPIKPQSETPQPGGLKFTLQGAIKLFDQIFDPK